MINSADSSRTVRTYFSPSKIMVDFFPHIRHNWSDEDCEKILRNVVDAMKENTEKRGTVRLLISTIAPFFIDFLMTETIVSDDIAFQQASPFEGAYQPNDLGKSRVLALDVNMLVLLGEAKERTVEDYARIGYVLSAL